MIDGVRAFPDSSMRVRRGLPLHVHVGEKAAISAVRHSTDPWRGLVPASDTPVRTIDLELWRGPGKGQSLSAGRPAK